MAGTTPKGFRFPEDSDAPNIAVDIENLADDVDAELDDYLTTAAGIAKSIVTAGGDLITASGSATPTRLGIGAEGRVLYSNGTAVSWEVDPTSDVVTTAGDLIYGTGADAVARLAIGTAAQVLAVNTGATAPEWVTPAGGGANWSLLNAGGTSLTGTLVTVSGISGADKIMVIVAGLSTTFASGSTIQVRLNADAGSNYYAFGGQISNTGTASSMVLEVNQTTTSVNLSNSSNDIASTTSGAITFTGCNSSGVKQFIGSGGGGIATGANNNNRTVQGYYNSSSVITSVSIRASGDTMDAGTVFVYTSA